MRRFSSTVRSMKVPRPSGTWATPRRTMSSVAGRRCAGRRSGSRPAVCTMPQTARRVVVLPAPLAPRMVVMPPCSTREVDAVQHLRRAVLRAAGRGTASQRRPPSCFRSPGRRGSRRGSPCTSAGVPSAILRPKSSATTWSDTRITRFMWCSTSRMVSSSSLADLAQQRAAARRPPRGSGRRPARRAAAAWAGSPARAPSSTRFCVPKGRSGDRRVGHRAEAPAARSARRRAPRSCASSRRTQRQAQRVARGSRCACGSAPPTMMFWRTLMRAEQRQVLEGAADAQRRDAVRRRSSERPALEPDLAFAEACTGATGS